MAERCLLHGATCIAAAEAILLSELVITAMALEIR